MTPDDLKLFIAKGEDSKTQFKVNITNPTQLAQELVAFANTLGGQLLIGISDQGHIIGLTDEDVRRLNQMVGNAASQMVRPPLYPVTEMMKIEDKNVMIVHIPFSANRPYATKDGIYLTRVGADKRRIEQDELRRLFQESGKLYAEEMPFAVTDWQDLDVGLFADFYRKKYHSDWDHDADLAQVFENLNLAADGRFNLAAILLFGKNIGKYYPLSQITGVSFFGNDLTGTTYRDNELMEGNLKTLFSAGAAFINRNLKKTQNGSFNESGRPEIPLLVFEELLVNALIHRDYFINSSIRLLIFDNRIEIISPGRLPNNLTVEKIKHGVSIRRNPTLASFAFDLLPFKGLGSGILRALHLYPHIDFVNDLEAEQFTAIVRRPLS